MKKSPLRTLAVMGLGTMGHGIAQAFATGGFPVLCYDSEPSLSSSLHARVEKNLKEFVGAGLIKSGDRSRILSRISVCRTEEEAVGGAQFVIEVVREDLALKQGLFARWEKMAAASTIFASNSSTFTIRQSAAKMKRQDRAILVHWFNPPHIVPTVEVVPGPKTSARTVRLTMDLLRRVGKMAVLLKKEIPGFLVNRIQMAMYREVWDLWSQGVASAKDIDSAIRGSVGFRLAAIGPLEVCDFGGLELQTRVYGNLTPEIRSDSRVPAKLAALVRSGGNGVKSGRGFYTYTPQSAAERGSLRDRRFLALLKLLYGRNGNAGRK